MSKEDRIFDLEERLIDFAIRYSNFNFFMASLFLHRVGKTFPVLPLKVAA